MKYCYFLFFILFYINSSFAQEKTVYLDVNLLLLNSEAGIYINNELKKINDKNIEEYKKIENSLKSDEEKLLKQKNILKENEFNDKANVLREKYKSYQILKNTKNGNLKKIRDDSSKQILKVVNDILAEYSAKNNISLIIDKKNIVIGKTELDITKNILDLLNNKIKKVELK